MKSAVRGFRTVETGKGRVMTKAKFCLILGIFGLLVGCSSNPQAARDNLLIRAAEKGATHEMVRLIRAGANINAQDAEGWTPYLAASTNGHFEAMRLLRGLGARTEAPDLRGMPLTSMP
jgi:hypothetical protein